MSEAAGGSGDRHWVLVDGECPFCMRSARWIRRRDRRGEFLPVPFQDAPSPPLTPELRAACRDSVHVVTREGRVLRGARATLFILERLGWGLAARVLSLPPLVGLSEAAYRLVAANRPFFGRFLMRETDEAGVPGGR